MEKKEITCTIGELKEQVERIEFGQVFEVIIDDSEE